MGRPPAIPEGGIEELLEKRDKVALTTGDVAEAFDCHRKTAHKRLKKLERAGKIESEEMSQADAWYLSKSDPIISLPDGGDLLPLRKWFTSKLREFYPRRALAQAMVASLVAWYFSGLLSALAVGIVVFTTAPAAILATTYVVVKTINFVLRMVSSSDDPSEKVAV